MTTSGTDYLPPELEHWRITATREIDQHVSDHGLCAVCGSAWPCTRAQLADVALAAL